MNCPTCHTEMQLLRFVSHGGRDGSVSEYYYRCVKCWRHETVVTEREVKGGASG